MYGVVKTMVVSPSRDDFTSARRAARQLALEQRVAAVYVWACLRCGRVQDREAPEECCGRVQAMLAVCQPERRLLLMHPAPSPCRPCPPWITAVPAYLSAGQAATPTLGDLATLALKRAYQRLEAGGTDVNLRDVVALARLAREIAGDQTAAELGKALDDLAETQQAFSAVLWAAHRHFGPGGGPAEDPRRWAAFMNDLRGELERVAGRPRPGAAKGPTGRPRDDPGLGLVPAAGKDGTWLS